MNSQETSERTKTTPTSQYGIEWPKVWRAVERAPNGQDVSEHRTVTSDREGADWSGGRRVVRKPGSQEGA